MTNHYTDDLDYQQRAINFIYFSIKNQNNGALLLKEPKCRIVAHRNQLVVKLLNQRPYQNCD